MLQIEALPAFSDNYIWLLADTGSRRCAVVDPGDAAPVMAWLELNRGWRLSDILITHHHHDHVGGVPALKAHCGARVHGPAHEDIPQRDHALDDGARLQVLGLPLRVLAVPGHTLGHIAYFLDDPEQPRLFSGDTLFAAGCGRLFEGTPEQMFHSLSRLATLPERTLVYCAHEYTLGNLRFAHAVEPGNDDTSHRLEQVIRLREQGRITLPSSIALEKATNPFLRTGEAEIRQACLQRNPLLGNPCPEQVFAVLRAWKDGF
ncbi:hydroxyacylglutathione hydrolase [Stutzerimonas kirkiae]|uniref:Hydroxyacylglutathione hydrolase n=1 Tax=Stutzerimonas kirkiae TaxID=2211392 RepID=A0A4Q9R634_9GAMM|nr:hydroxyacylglutathione hydrolase [Stutzerimonas kirkiae]TBU96013.1 hydroxyacylglutathione hydrolase [Stutzerimonas kirkiae]TBV03156.1 hydroxyacylglutathione hydrolase [Stutzerimonas kirkiae]TBV09761.1 hydroxyacylglutathione hydrolase [Stutzerimonas kirkiae]